MLGNMLGIISYGLMSTLSPSTGAGEWIGYQIIAGTGRGLSLQMPILVVQSAIPKVEMATGTSIVVWCQFFGGAVFLSIAQVVFISALRTAFHDWVPDLDVSKAIDGGATAFMASLPEEQREDVLQAYNQAITRTFYLGLALAAASLLTSIGIWTARVETSLGKKTETVEEAAVIETSKEETK